MTPKDSITDFKTIEEARKFWETQSLADFADDLEVVNDVQFVKRNNLVISLNLEKEDMKRLRLLARKKKIGLTDMINLLVKEQLRGTK
ncbi:MAG: CopG family antitoxin [Bacillota bacterium]|nr:CopG family antitoxin [Bacillota bacterium]